MEILLGINSSPDADWRKNIERLGELGIKKVGVFPTYLEREERFLMYEMLKDAGVEVPFVHLRHDLDLEEIEYLKKELHTKVFNIHLIDELIEKLMAMDSKIRKNIYIENGDHDEPKYFDNLKDFGGICLDLTHYVDHSVIQKEKTYEQFANELSKHKIGIIHISAISDTLLEESSGWKVYERHQFDKLNQLDYVKDCKELLMRSEVVVLELDNSIDEQIKARKYIESLLK